MKKPDSNKKAAKEEKAAPRKAKPRSAKTKAAPLKAAPQKKAKPAATPAEDGSSAGIDIYLLRHGIAEAYDAQTPSAVDSDRALTARGKRRMKRITRGMEALGLCFDVIVSSPFARARQTAEVVAPLVAGGRDIILCDALTPAGDPQALLAALRKIEPRPKSVLLVGHEPYLGDLAGLWLSGSRANWVAFKKGGLCKLSVEGLDRFWGATLGWLLTPRQMMLMG